MITLSNRMSIHTSLPSVIHIEDADVPFVFSVIKLGVTLDSNRSKSQHINNTCKTAYTHIRRISFIRHLLTTRATQTFVGSLVLSRLVYCTSLLSTKQTVCGSHCKKIEMLRRLRQGLCTHSQSHHIIDYLDTQNEVRLNILI